MIRWLLRSLNSRIRAEIAEWLEGNAVMRRERYMGLDGILSSLSLRPYPSIALLLILFFILMWLTSDSLYHAVYAWEWPSELRFNTWVKEHRDHLIPLFLGIWAIQATIAALVYPLVLAFVALLLQGKTSSPFVRAYLHYSGAVFAGPSAMALIVALLIPFALMTWRDEWVSNRELAWVCVFAALWLLVNLWLTLQFLRKTLAFLSSRRKYREVVRYALCVVWPYQVQLTIAEVLHISAGQVGLLPEFAGATVDVEGPVVRLLSLGRSRDTQRVSSIYLNARRELGDVWYRLLDFAVSRWRRRAQKLKTGPEGQPRKHVLYLPLTPGDVYEGETALIEVDGSVSPNLIERAAIRLSYRFRKERLDTDSNVEIYLRALIQDARSAIASNNQEDFREALGAVIDLHGKLLKGSEFVDGDSSPNSFSLQSESMLGRQFHQTWSWCYTELIEDAVDQVERTTRYFEAMCNLPSRLLQELGDTEVTRPREWLIKLSPNLLWHLARWWKQRIELQGDLTHAMCDPALLKPPYLDTHQRLLKSWVGYWETMRDAFFSSESRTKSGDWLWHRRWSESYAVHLDETAQVLMAAVHRGDRLGAEYLADALQKWIASLELRAGRNYFWLQRRHLLTIENLRSTWEEVVGEFVREDLLGRRTSEDEVFFVAIRNYWIDVRCVVTFILVIWARECECERSLPADILRGLLDGRSWLGGAERQVDEAALNRGGAWLLKQFIRQRFAGWVGETRYENRLGSLVEKLLGVKEEEWVPGRIHSFWGATDLNSVLDGQLMMLLIFSQKTWDPLSQIESDVRGWMSDPSRIRDIQDYLQRLLNRLGDQTFADYGATYDCVTKGKSAIPFAKAQETLSEAIGKARQFLSDLRSEGLKTASISAARLADYSRNASQSAFDRDTGAFPLGLFDEIGVTNDAIESKRLVVKAMSKGGFTEPEMEQRAANEEDWIAQAMKEHVGAIVLGSALAGGEWVEIQTATPNAYWAALRATEKRLLSEGLTPILILDNATRPAWVWDWMNEIHGDEDAYRRPAGLTYSKDDDQLGEGYLGHFNGTAIYVARMSSGSSLFVARELFHRAEFRQFGNGYRVQASVAPVADDFAKVDLTLEWGLRLNVGPKRVVRLRYGPDGQ
jgi:hypothetical protein